MQAIIDTDKPLSPPAARYAGWYRAGRREPWKKIVEATSYDEAWGKLLDKLAELSQRGGESTVVRGDVNPDQGSSSRQTVRATR
jgi:hypothetical protein